MKQGDKVIIELAGRKLEGRVEIASSNGKSLGVSVDGGVPPPFLIHEMLGLQVLLLTKQDDGSWTDVASGRTVEVG